MSDNYELVQCFSFREDQYKIVGIKKNGVGHAVLVINKEGRCVAKHDKYVQNINRKMSRRNTLNGKVSGDMVGKIHVKFGLSYVAFMNLHLAAKNKLFTEIVGIPPKNAVAIMNKTMMETFLDNKYRGHLDRVCRLNGRYSPQMVDRFIQNRGVVDEVIQDGLNNIVPVVGITGLRPAELKKELGKSTWRKIAHNSYTRNTYIARICFHGLMENPKGSIGFLKKIIDLPSFILVRARLTYNLFRYYNNGDDTDYERRLFIKLARYKDNYVELERKQHIVRDVKRMASDLGRVVPKNPSAKRISELHEEFTKAIRARKFSDERFENLDPKLESEINKLKVGRWECRLLDSKLAIALEGDAMNHCVASYAGRAADGKCHIISLTNGSDRSTLEVRIHQDGEGKTVYVKGQHYSFCNEHVQDDDAVKLAADIVNKCNELVDSKEETECMYQKVACA